MNTIDQEGFSESSPSGFSNFLSNSGKYIAFVAVMGLISGLFSAIGMFLLPTIPAGVSKWVPALISLAIVPAALLVGSFIGAFMIWALVDGVLSGKWSQYGLSYKIVAVLAAFSPVTALLNLIPSVGQVLGLVVNVWSSIIMIIGIIIVRKTPVIRTWIVTVLIFLFLFLMGVIASTMARQLSGGLPPDLGAGFEDDLGAIGGDDLDKALEELSRQAEQNQPR